MTINRLSFILWFFLFPISIFATTTVRHDPEEIKANDSFRLIISSNEINKDGLPNLTSLQTDFVITGTEHNVSYNIINGQSSALTQWIIILRPKRTGTLTIPGIKLGGETTAPSSIRVLESQATLNNVSTVDQTSSPEGIKLDTQISDPHPYVNQQVLYTVKLYNNQRLIDAQYHPPSVENALIIPLGDGRHYQTQENDQLYMVEEQAYAIFPQKSGPFTINPPFFEAAIFDDEGYPKRVHLQGKKTDINIQPTPANFKYKSWLPAKKVSLTEKYDVPSSGVKVGDTITRTVNLQAIAMPAQLLPTPDFVANDQYKVYLDNPDIQNTINQNELIGSSTIKVTYLFNQQGNVTIPKLEIPWFNTSTGKAEIASLPSRLFIVGPSASKSVKTLDPKIVGNSSSNEITTPKVISFNSQRFSSVFILLLGLVSGGLIVWLLTKWPPSNSFKIEQNAAAKQVVHACQRNNPKEAQEALLKWGQLKWPEKRIFNLQDIGNLCRDILLKKELQKLSLNLYSDQTSTSWKGNGLKECFEHYLKNSSKFRSKKNTAMDLPPLNPN